MTRKFYYFNLLMTNQIPEAATLSCSIGLGYVSQLSISQIQKNNEDVVFDHAEKFIEDLKNVVILLDRGIIDGSVYHDAETFQKVMEALRFKNKGEIFKRYDSVLCLLSAANGAEMFYDQNEVRRESIELAKEVDKKTVKVFIFIQIFSRF